LGEKLLYQSVLHSRNKARLEVDLVSDPLISAIFEANLSFSALLLAVQGILISLYLKAEHEKWKHRFRVLLAVCGGTFFAGIIDCLLSLFYMLSTFPSVSNYVFNLIVALFIGELTMLVFASLLLVGMLVTR